MPAASCQGFSVYLSMLHPAAITVNRYHLYGAVNTIKTRPCAGVLIAVCSIELHPHTGIEHLVFDEPLTLYRNYTRCDNLRSS